LIPYVEKQFRAIGRPQARVLSGVSTGGWASLALQVFYPDFFNGSWSFCPDPVDFRAFELVNIYEDDNAYVNQYGFERPSERTVAGDVRLTLRREVRIENVLSCGDSWTMSGGDWGAWNAVFGPRGTNGLPVALWNPQTGLINHEVAAEWKKYDLRLVMQQIWMTLGPKLQGKLHIAAGDADNYYLNNAVHLLDEFLAHADPPFKGRIVYGPGEGHGWTDIPLDEMLKEMEAATAPAKK
jgi:S-formylglutathione hydrolase FrmB